MRRSFVLLRNVPATLQPAIAAGHRVTNPLATGPVDVNTLEGARRAYATKSNLYGAGNVYSTTRDLLRLHQALQRGRIISTKTQSEMYAPAKLSSGQNYLSFSRTNYPAKDGLGWFVTDVAAGMVDHCAVRNVISQTQLPTAVRQERRSCGYRDLHSQRGSVSEVVQTFGTA
jgi:CubicO group peptidase (beta-lactamase class C family)